MKALLPLAIAVVATAVVVLLVVQPPVVISNAFVDVVPPDSAIVGFNFANWGLREVCIVGVKAPAGLEVELHRTEFINGTIAIMKEVNRICAGPFSTVRVGPLSYHIHLIGNVSQIGNSVTLELILSDGRRLTVTAPKGAGPYINITG